jgi:amino acid adenylation domain-containing protein
VLRQDQLPAAFDHLIDDTAPVEEPGSPLRLCLVTLAEDRHALVIQLSPLCADARTFTNLFEEISDAYAAHIANDSERLLPQPLQYAQFAEWQNELLEDADASAGKSYWRERTSGASAPLTLPIEHSVVSHDTSDSGLVTLALDPAIRTRMTKIASGETDGVALCLLACWQVLLSRVTGRADLTIGYVSDGRAFPELEGGFGVFAKCIPFACRVENGRSFGSIVTQASEAIRDATQWADYWTWAESDTPGGIPQWPVGFEFEKRPARRLAGGLEFSIQSQHTCVDLFKLRLACIDTADSLTAKFHYDGSVLTQEGVRSLSASFHQLLASVVDAPDVAVDRLELLSADERRKLLVEFNRNAAADESPEWCVHEMFEAQVARVPDAEAVRGADESLSYRTLNERANQLAHHLRRRGVGPECVVGVCLTRSAALVVGLLGVLKAGAAYLPLDPRYPPARLAFLLRDAGITVLLAEAQLRERLPSWPGMSRLELDEAGPLLAADPVENPCAGVGPQHLAYVIYTSGSTGTPKGTLIPHRGLSNYLRWCTAAYRVDEGGGVPVHSSLGFDLTITSLWAPLVTGQCVVLVPESLGVEALGSTLEEQTDWTLLKLTPSHLELLAQQLAPAATAGRVRALVIGGEALSGETLRFWRAHAPATRLLNEYGPTETVVGCCVYEVPPDAPLEATVPIGRPIAGMQLYVLDAHLQPVPVGVTGELYIGGLGLARGYLHHAGLTAATFIPHPYSAQPGARLYATGDLARYRSDGIFEFLGRRDRQVKLRGHRVELAEIEAVLLQHPGVRETTVLLRDNSPGGPQLVAFVVPQSTAAPTAAALREFVQRTLPDYMVPHRLILLADWPLTPHGKVDHAALLALPDPDLPATRGPGPVTPLQELLAGLWEHVLDRPHVQFHDNFFDLGGHSLLATQLISRLRAALHLELPLRLLFDHPTLHDFAAQVASLLHPAPDQAPLPPIRPVPRDTDLPLSFAQQRLWFLDQLEPGNPAFGVPITVRLTGPLNVPALSQSLNEIVRRHESLRTSFPSPNGQPIQNVASNVTFPVPMTDLTGWQEGDQIEELNKLRERELQLPWNLASGPVLRARLLRLTDREHVLLLATHHISFDGWSIGVLIDELASLYEAFTLGNPSPLLPLAVQYADFAVWQRQWLQGKYLKVQLDYWREQLAGAPPMLALPTDRPRPAFQTFNGDAEALVIPKDVALALKELSQREGVTLFMTLLAAFKLLLARYSGQQDISVGSYLANRSRIETEGLIGFFVNTVVLRTRLSDDLTFRQLLPRVRDTALGAYAHQDVPFEKLLEELRPERALDHSPFFQVMFVLQNAPMPAITLTELAVSPVPMEIRRSNFDLTLWMAETADGLSGSLEYNTDLFNRATARRLLEHFQTLLSGITADPDQPLARLPLVRDADRSRLLAGARGPRGAFADAPCVHHLFEAQVERTPEKVALIVPAEEPVESMSEPTPSLSNATILTYDELNRRANQLAYYLRRQGVGPEVHVGLCVPRSSHMLVAVLAVLKSGGSFVPIDPAYPAQRLAFVLKDAQIDLLITIAGAEPRFAGGGTRMICIDKIAPDIASEPDDNPSYPMCSDNLAYIIYTSGSTGQPKGVAVTHRSLVSYVRSACEAYGLQQNDRVLQFASLAFDASAEEIFPSLSSGAALLLRTSASLASTRAILKACDDWRITVLNLPTAFWHELAASGTLASIAFPRAARLLIIGGEEARQADLAVWQRNVETQVRLVNTYGPTEATIVATRCDLTFADPTEPVPIGRAIRDVNSYILDAHLQFVPVGVPGELYLGGAGLARGYHGRPGLTAEVFVPDPFSDEPGARMYRTGDRARYRTDGAIEFLGRYDRQVKIRGFRVELGEIEAVLEEHPAVKNAAVVKRNAEGDSRLVAYIVAHHEGEASHGDLRNFLKERLPDHAVPSVFVALTALPRTPQGKLDPSALPPPDPLARGPESVPEAPRTSVEHTLSDVWAELLDVPQPGLRDNFFALGGHSMLVTRLLFRVHDAFQIDVPLRVFFENPTIAELGLAIEELLLKQVEALQDDELADS